ncbi:MAG: AraC family transcriptional regulator [Planctomycetota bacterium]|jgi:AraC family transcriptional activator of pobA|nr:AraC family transcriptional regulator [Planctomycetota bacterium]
MAAEPEDSAAERHLRCAYRHHLRIDRHGPGLVGQHRHSFCQLEIITAGQVVIETPQRRFDCRAGDAVLIPSGCVHGLSYPEPVAGFVSIKFAVAGGALGSQAQALPTGPLCTGLQAALLACLPSGSVEPEAADRLVLEYSLAALVAHVAPEATEPSGGDAVMRKLDRILRRLDGRSIGVAELAQQLGLSPSRLSARVRAVTGAGCKPMIDRARGEAAARLLTYADHDIATIADLLEFPDPFTFSRFFSRVMGESPRAWRERTVG